MKTYQDGKKNRSNRSENDLKTGEIVDAIIIGMDYPRAHLKQIDDMNKTNKEDAEVTGAEYIPLEPTYKDSGIEFTIAILARNDGEDKIWKPTKENDALIKPGYPAVATFTVYSPRALYQLRGKKGNKIGDMHKMGGGDEINRISGKPEVVALYPHCVLKEKLPKGADFTSARTYAEIPEDELRIMPDLVKEETKRRADWKELLLQWTDYDEEQCYKELLEYSARRLFLFDPEMMKIGKVEYLPPKIGMIFKTSIDRYVENNGYFNIKGYPGSSGWKRSVVGQWEPIVYSTGAVYNEFGAILANKINQARLNKIIEEEILPNDEDISDDVSDDEPF